MTNNTTTATATAMAKMISDSSLTESIWNDDNVSTGSADSSTSGSTCHECSTTGVLNSNLLLSTSEELLQQTFRWMFWSPQHLVKDDVFLAPIINIDIKQIDDTTTPTTNTTTIPTPCLSPVTSPSDLLYDHEPLFDGIDYELLDQSEATESDPVIKKSERVSIMSDDLDWSALSSQFTHDDYDDFLPPTPSTAIEEEQQVFDMDDGSLDEYESEEDEEYTEIVITKKRKSLKRKLEEPLLLYTSKKSKHNSSLTVFETLTQSGIDWCRYCGTTEGVNWRPGPWGKRTLCNKHGCDYKGYGLASRLPRLDLSAFTNEKLQDRRRPIVQQFCVICQCPENKENKLVVCQGGCSRAYHRACYPVIKSQHNWYCNSTCQENRQRNRVVVDLPRKYLPLMRLQQQQQKKLRS